jgi:hypothetical protein
MEKYIITLNKLKICLFVSFFVVCTVVSCGNTSILGTNTGDSGTTGQDSGKGDKPETPGTSEPTQTPAVLNTTWYVSQSGSDSAAGNSGAAPLATVQAALSKIKSLYRGGNWPVGESAVIVVSGKITATSGSGPVGAMVDVSGAGNYPPVILKGDAATGGILDAGKVSGDGRQVLYIGNNKVTLGDNLVLTGGRSLWGGAVCIGTHGSDSEGEFVMAGGEIRGNSSGSGGGVMIYKGSMSMLGGRITENDNDFHHTGGSGGGVYMMAYTYFIMSGGEISKNGGVNTNNGGGLFIDGDSKAYLTGGEITGNVSSNKGGGAYVFGDFTMSGGTISGNTSNTGGGVSTSQNMGKFNKTGGLVTGNKPNDT